MSQFACMQLHVKRNRNEITLLHWEQMLPLLMWKLRNSPVCFLMMKSKHMCRADLTLARLSDEMCGQKLQLCFCIPQITFAPNTIKRVWIPETCNISINSRLVCWHGFGQTLESQPGITDSPTLCWPCSFSSVPGARRVAFLFSYLRQSNRSFPAHPCSTLGLSDYKSIHLQGPHCSAMQIFQWLAKLGKKREGFMGNSSLHLFTPRPDLYYICR